MKFKDLTKDEEILRAIERLGFTEPTPIQIQSIPIIQEGRDFIAQSQTGTGKTAAFGIPSIEKIDPDIREEQVLVICPTRELAVQVAREYKKLLKYKKDMAVSAVFGGEPIVKQIRELKKKPQVIVGTPGRLRDHIRRRTLKLRNIKLIILDEADEMLKMGFIEELEDIFSNIDYKTQNLMFSATIPKTVEHLSKKYLDNPVKVKIEPKNIASETVKQSYVAIQKKQKKAVVGRILDYKNPSRCIIFCNTKKMVDDLIAYLQEKGYSADRIHGDLKQEQRMAVLSQFNKGHIAILVATDVAGRGLDIQNVDLVINYDLPEKEDSYVHRIGRSGRAGKAGEAVTLVSTRDKHMLHSIERYIKQDIAHKKVPSQKKVNDVKVEHFIENCLNELSLDTIDDYKNVLSYISEKGYSLEEVTVALLHDRLQFSKEKDIDYNDHYFHKNKQKKNTKSKSKASFKSKTKSKRSSSSKSNMKPSSNGKRRRKRRTRAKGKSNGKAE